MILFLSALALLYIFFVCTCFVFWIQQSRKNLEPNKNQVLPVLTILCVGRNEATNLPDLMECLIKIDYPSKWEFIFVDDHSEDDSIDLLSKYQINNFRYISSPQGLVGKKACQAYGVSLAFGDWVLFTDADCTFESTWPLTMVSHALNEKKDWIGGIVAQFEGESYTFLNNWQKIETLYLNVIGGVMINFGLPVLANGANMLVNKKKYVKMNENQLRNPSGDDVLLLQNIVSNFGRKQIGFCFAKQSKVCTKSPVDFKPFLEQKIRWASKFNVYQRIDVKLFLLIFGIIQLAWVFLLLIDPKTWILLSMIKLFIELFFFSYMAKHYQVKQNLFFSLITNVTYPIYSLLISILARMSPIEWKKRTYQL